MSDQQMRFSTRAIHVGQEPDPSTGATVPPIYATSTYTQAGPGEHKGYEYSRSQNPTRNGLERCLAALEGGAAGACFASGLAATNGILSSLLRPGDTVVAYSDLYGGTYRIFERVFRPWGLNIRYTDDKRPEAFAKLVDASTRMVWLETPTNPMLHLLDIQAIVGAVRGRGGWPQTLESTGGAGVPARESSGAGVPARESSGAGVPARESSGAGVPARESSGAGVPARESSGAGVPARMGVGTEARTTQAVPAPGGGRGPVLVVDNTFASPALQQPLALGADIVLHSTTKYLGGHSDVVGGAVITKDAAMMAPIRFVQNASGGVSGPFDSFLTHRGVKTLPIRMKAHCANALRVAEWAVQQNAFEKVIYPGLPSHPDHELAKRQMCGAGGMVTCVLRGGFDAAKKFMAATKLFSCAESLGGVESLINHPAIMTHASIPREIRERIGVVDALVRLSVGIEDVEDLIADLEQALHAAK